jgi:hypothetical protein
MPSLDRPRIEYRTPVDLVAEVKDGALRIPPFQRSFKWDSSDVAALFDSILRGFPVGNLLFWRRAAPAAAVHVGPLAIDAPSMPAANWVVDGQQRITGLVGALVAEDVAGSRFRIFLDLDTAQFHSLGARQQPRAHSIPVSRLATTESLLSWMRENADWMTDDHVQLADQAAEAVREYQIPAYVVRSVDEQRVRQIFDRVNSHGKHLDAAEVFHALHSGFAGDRPVDLKSIGAVPAQLGFGAFDERLALRCVLAYRGGDIFREDFAGEFASDEDRADTFREVAAGLRVVVEFLGGEAGIPHVKVLPYSHIVPVLVRFVRRYGEPTKRLSRLLRRWVWRDAVAGVAAGGMDVPALRQAMAALDASDPYDAVEQLLRQTRATGHFEPDLSQTDLHHATAKINLLGLTSADPRDIVTGQPLDLAGVFDGDSPVRTIAPDADGPLAATFANRVVDAARSRRPIRELLATASQSVAASHLVDERGQALLASGDLDGFLEHRHTSVRTAVRNHVNGMAEWGARNGRSVADIMKSVA